MSAVEGSGFTCNVEVLSGVLNLPCTNPRDPQKTHPGNLLGILPAMMELRRLCFIWNGRKCYIGLYVTLEALC